MFGLSRNVPLKPCAVAVKMLNDAKWKNVIITEKDDRTEKTLEE